MIKPHNSAETDQPAAPVEPAPVEPTAPVETPAAPEAPPADEPEEEEEEAPAAPEAPAVTPPAPESAVSKPGLVARVMDTITLRTGHKSEIARLQGALAASNKRADDLDATLKIVSGQNVNLTEDLKKALDRVSALEAAAQVTPEKVSKAAQQQLASLGVPMADLPAQSPASDIKPPETPANLTGRDRLAHVFNQRLAGNAA